MEKSKKRNGCFAVLVILLLFVFAGAVVGEVYAHFGGFGTGECADVQEFADYARPVSDIEIPVGTRIVALGEASHGNAEFQSLRLEVFRRLVESCGVRAIALESDFGCCEAVNRYIHGGEGEVSEAASNLGMDIYRTAEMEALIDWMRDYNDSAAEGEDLRFYGFDMQDYRYDYKYLLEAVKSLGLDSAKLEELFADGRPSEGFDRDERTQIYESVKQELAKLVTEENSDEIEFITRFADTLLQNDELGRYVNDFAAFNQVRDGFMAENTLWLLEQEEKRGNTMLFVTGHNGHIAQRGSSGGAREIMGADLCNEIGSDAYFAIGTDFYKSTCNLPKITGERIERTFYSYDPLAKAAYKNGCESCWLDFSLVPDSSPLSEQINGKIHMGNLGESYNLLIRLMPRAYRQYDCPSALYDGMIFVPEATPIEIK